MNKKQEIKQKKASKKETQTSSNQPFKPIEKYHYQTSQTNYNININCEQVKHQNVKPEKMKSKSNKKIKYLTEGIEKSDWVQLPRQHSGKKDITIKVSTLNNIEDLNVYQKARSSKKSKKASSKQQKQDKLRHNAKVNHQNNKIKIRDVKSHSKSAKKLTLKSFVSKEKEKSKSKKSLKPKITKQSSKQFQQLHPHNLQVENSYYFSNYPDTPVSQTSHRNIDTSNTYETTLTSKKKQQMFLFQSKDESWRKPKKTVSHLQGTIDLLN